MINYKKMAVMNTAGNVFYLFSIWILTVITTRMIDYTAAGYFTLAMSVGNMFFTLQMFGMRSFQVSDIKGEYSPDQYVYSRYVTTVIGFLLCLGYCIIFIHEKEKFTVIIAFMMLRSSEAVSDVYHGELQKIGRLDIAVKSMFAKGIFMLVLFPIILRLTKNLSVALMGAAISAALVTLFYDRARYSALICHSQVRFRWKEISAPICSCVGLFFTNIFPIIVTALPRIMLERYSGTEILGYYGNVSAPTVLITTVVPSVLIPIMTWYGEMLQLNQFRRVYSGFVKSLLACFVFGILACTTVRIAGEWVMALIFTDAIIPYVHYMYLLIISTVIYAWSMCVNSVLIVMRKTKAVFVCSGISFVCAIVTAAPLVKTFAVYGAIMVLVITYLVQFLLLIGVFTVSIRKQKRTENENDNCQM